MRRALTLAACVVAVWVSSAAATVGGYGVDDTCACGGTVYLIWTMSWWPNGLDHDPWCERHWSNGAVTVGLCW